MQSNVVWECRMCRKPCDTVLLGYDDDDDKNKNVYDSYGNTNLVNKKRGRGILSCRFAVDAGQR